MALRPDDLVTPPTSMRASTTRVSRLRGVGEANLARWDGALGEPADTRGRQHAAVTRLCAFADVFLTAPEHHPHEFPLQQELLADHAADYVLVGVPDRDERLAALDRARAFASLAPTAA
ncbi:MAG: hypothetical protein ACT452_13460 [Microthrixaceae bacterium]